MNKKQKFVFPESLLAQVNECSNGGFLLVNFDEDKNPCVYFQFDDGLSSLAILSYTENWAQAMKNVNKNILTQSLEKSFTEDLPEDDEGFGNEK